MLTMALAIHHLVDPNAFVHDLSIEHGAQPYTQSVMPKVLHQVQFPQVQSKHNIIGHLTIHNQGLAESNALHLSLKVLSGCKTV